MNFNRLYGVYQNGYIGFRKADYIDFEDVWDGSVSGGHYELIDKYSYPYVGASDGIPMWNDKGEVSGKKGNANRKTIYVNNTGYGTSLSLWNDYDNNFPNRFFIPTQAGTQGQVLTSTGGEEPTWATMIKSVKITSDAYEALVQAGTVDPNTLYLIVDE